jgi:NAD(P) transhydrogenase
MLGQSLAQPIGTIPIGIYTIPEMASVGLTEAQAIERHGGVLVGRADFSELARGQISGDTEGLLKLYADPADGRILGAQIIGDSATELIHLAQLAMISSHSVEVFVEQVFNFPTMAEAYRVAALDILAQRSARRKAA